MPGQSDYPIFGFSYFGQTKFTTPPPYLSRPHPFVVDTTLNSPLLGFDFWLVGARGFDIIVVFVVWFISFGMC